MREQDSINQEQQLRELLDKLIERAKEDIENVSRDLKQSETDVFALVVADVWSETLERDVNDIRDIIWELRGEIDV